MADVGERITAVAVQLQEFEKYNHERWHKLNNDLQPLVNLPERFTRELGRMQGTFEGRLSTLAKEMERSTETGIEKALKSLDPRFDDHKERLDDHEAEIKNLNAWRSQWTGAKIAILLLGQALLNAVIAIGAVLSVTGHHV